MGIFDRFRKREEQQEVSPPVSDVLLRALLGGETITREKALTLPAVAGAVDYISNTVASMPVRLFKYKQGSVVEVDDDPRVKMLNGDTHDTLDAFQLKKAMVEDYLLGKGGYCYIERYRNDVTGLFYVEDRFITILKNFKPIYKDYVILVEGKQYEPFNFIKLLRNTKDGAFGIGLTEEVSKALETAYSTLIYQLGLVKSGGNKRGFLESQRKLGTDEINALKKAWKNLYSTGEENVVVLNNGIQFREASNTAVESQLNESKNTLTNEINNLFHIYPNDFNRTFKESIYPIVKAFETALNKDLLLEKEKKNMFFSFDVKEVLKATIQERYESYKLAKETGFLTLNEIRKAENLNHIEGLDVVNVGLGAVLYDINKHIYYTPNTDTIGDMNDGNNGGDDPNNDPNNGGNIDKMLEDHELVESYDASGNSAERANDNHDSKTGQFAPKSGSSGTSGNAKNASSIDKDQSSFESMSNNKKGAYLYQNHFMSQKDALQAMKDGTIAEKGKEYFDIMRENGDPTPTGATRDNSQSRLKELVDNGVDYTPARAELIKKDTGFSDEEVAKTQKELDTWFDGSWDKADTATLDRYVERSPSYDGEMYRGMHFENANAMNAFLRGAKAGDRISMGGKNSSWTNDEETARGFAHHNDDTYSSVLITCVRNRTSSPVADLSTKGESEILASSTAQWTIIGREDSEPRNGNQNVHLYVVETGG